MNFPFISSNIPSAPAYGVYVSQLIRYACCSINYSEFLLLHRTLAARLLSQGYKVNCLSNTCKKFFGRHTDLGGQNKKNVCQMFCWSYQLKWFSFFMDLPIAKLIKFAKMAGVMHEADHAYSIWSTWWLHRLAPDVLFIACAVNSPLLLPITWICRILSKKSKRLYFYNISNTVSAFALLWCSSDWLRFCTVVV